MPHVELSLQLVEPELDASSISRWTFAVAAAPEPCLLLDGKGVVVAASPGCAALLSIDPIEAVGAPLVEGVLHLLDFNRTSGQLPDSEVDKIPPLIALRSGRLARGLLRLDGPRGHATVDAISAPLFDRDGVIGSLTFFAPVG